MLNFPKLIVVVKQSLIKNSMLTIGFLDKNGMVRGLSEVVTDQFTTPMIIMVRL